jgi:peroxiredoxin
MKTGTRLGAVALLAAVLALAACESGRQGPDVGSPAPEFRLSDLDGNVWRLSDLRGSVVVVNFWATWCPPCREEMPSLQQLFQKTLDAPDVVILTVLFNDDPKNAYEYVKRNGYGFPVLRDPDGSVAAAYGLTGVPETFFIDRSGVLRNWVIGPMGFDSPQVMGYLAGLVEEQG